MNTAVANAAIARNNTRNLVKFAPMLPCRQCGAPAPAGKQACQMCDNNRRANR